MMNMDEVKENITSILTEPYSAQIYFVLKTDGGYELRLADIEDTTEPELQDYFRIVYA